MKNDELESQLSAMFDGELPASECELLARRLARDETLKARWGRYAAIGAAMRMEPSAFLCGSLARRVSSVMASEPSLLVGVRNRDATRPALQLRKWWRPAAGVAGTVAAAGAAAVVVFVLRTSAPATGVAVQELATASPRAAVATVQPTAYTSISESAVHRASLPLVERASFAPPTQLVDFLVAHSEFSMPFLQRTALSALVGSATVQTMAPLAPAAAGNDAVGDSSANSEVGHAAAPR